MRIERLDPRTIRLVLSERNLRALLSKLSMPDSACTLSMVDDDGTVYVSAEPDAQHYGSREPGPMHPVTEDALKR